MKWKFPLLIELRLIEEYQHRSEEETQLMDEFVPS
jgi:hypothetical protein